MHRILYPTMPSTIAMFSITLFYAYFEVSHQKQVMEMANKKKESLNSQKSFYAHLVFGVLVFFYLCEK